MPKEEKIVICFRKQRRAKDKDDYETWIESNETNTINCFDIGDIRSTTIIVESKSNAEDN